MENPSIHGWFRGTHGYPHFRKPPCVTCHGLNVETNIHPTSRWWFFDCPPWWTTGPRALLVSHKAKDKSDMEALNAWIVTAKYVKMEHTIATSHNDTMVISTVSALGCLCMRATKTSRRAVFRTCVLHNFIIIRSTSNVFRLYLVWEKWSIFAQHAQNDVEFGWCFWKNTYGAGVFIPILTENYVKFNIVWNRLCPRNFCHRIKMGKTKRGLRGIFIIIFVQKLSKSVRI